MMKILYTTDGSEGALCAGGFLAGLPLQQTDHIHIVTVLGDEDTALHGRERLSRAGDTLGGFPGQVTTSVARGNSTSAVVEALLFAAVYADADLIALGASGHSAVACFFLGSVSEGVTRHADRPILLVRPSLLPLREVIIGVDGSESARAAAAWTSNTLPLPIDCGLRLMQAVTTPGWLSYPETVALESHGEILDRSTQDEADKAQDYLDALASQLADSRGDTRNRRMIETETTVGHAAEKLIRLAERRRSGLIVVGSHGLTGINRFLLGSISENVLRHAPCSVLVFRPSAVNSLWRP